MKVLHMISGGDTGGAKTHVFALLGKLKTMADVKIVCFMEGVFWTELKEIGVDCELICQKSRFDMSVVGRLEEICREGVDVIHCHGARANFIAAFLRRRVDIPMITTIHSDYLLDFDGFYRKLVYTTLNVWALKKFRYFIGVSSSFKDMLISRGFRPNAVYTVYNGMDYSGTPAFDDKETFAKRIGIAYDPSKTYVGLIGRHDHVKGHDVFIKAMRRVLEKCPDTVFVIAGEGENRASLVELAEKEGVADHLVFAGFIKDIYSFIHFIDINTLTSRSESFPYVLMEGARFSKPTVCSRVGGIPDFVKDGETGLLFENEDHAALAEKLVTLIRDRALAASYGKALHTLAVTKFSDTALAEKHMEIYDAVLRDYRDTKRYDVVMSGYYGFQNSGDDALLYAIIGHLRAAKPDIRICVLSKNAARTGRRFGVDCVGRFRLCQVKKAIRGADMLISGGGSLLQDATSSKSLTYYLAVMRLAKRMGRKVFVYANGLGPFKDKNLHRVAKVLEAADGVTLRDEQSLEEITRMGLPVSTATVTADPALALSGAPTGVVDALLRSENIPGDRRFLGVSVRDWQDCDENFHPGLAESIAAAAKRYGLTPLFIPMRFPHDVALSRRIADMTGVEAYVLSERHEVNEIIGVVSRCDLVVGMRLHLLIYATAASVPSVGLIYDKKISGFLDYVGQKTYVDIGRFDGDALDKTIERVMADRASIVSALEVRREELCRKAEENAVMAVKLLSDGKGDGAYGGH